MAIKYINCHNNLTKLHRKGLYMLLCFIIIRHDFYLRFNILFRYRSVLLLLSDCILGRYLLLIIYLQRVDLIFVPSCLVLS